MGRFSYEQGESVQFSIGDIVLPETPANDVIHVSNIFSSSISDQRVINLARLLLTLDEDQNFENGISISASAFSASLGTNIDFSSTTFETDVANYLSKAGGATTLISEIDATTHIQETLVEANNFTSFQEDAQLLGCIIVPDSDTAALNGCAQRATFNDHVANFSPRHQQINVPIDTKITVAINPDSNTGTGVFNVELFPIKAIADRCRIDLGGFICGDDAPFDTRAAFSHIINGIEFLDGTVALNPIIFGTASIDISKNVVFTPERALASGVTYVVHVFANPGFPDFKTWWIFKT